MKKKIKNKSKYSEEPINLGKRVKDFLPSPEELIMKDPAVKVTILLHKESVDFFKSEASKFRTSYQRMIRNLLQEYARKMKRSE